MKLFIPGCTSWLVGVMLLLNFSLLQSAPSQMTNAIPPNLYLTDNGMIFFHNHAGERVVSLRIIKAAQESAESRPANEDPEGHWGQATNGFQLSLRFETTTFTNGEPVAATTLMRNVTDASQTYFRPIEFTVIKDGKALKKKGEDELRIITMPPTRSLFPQTQDKCKAILNSDYDFSDGGEYTIQAISDQPPVISQTVNIVIAK